MERLPAERRGSAGQLAAQGAAHAVEKGAGRWGTQRNFTVARALVQDMPITDSLPHVSKMNKAVQELVGHYIALEEFGMQKNVRLVRRQPAARAVGWCAALIAGGARRP